MIKKVMGNLFPRGKYSGASTARVYLPKGRSELQKLFGGASRVYFHARVYDRSGTTPSLDFEVASGCFNGENPFEGLRVFTQTPTNQTPALPYATGSMGSLPDDGTFMVTPGMGLLDIGAKVSGTGSVWIEFEVWYTAEFD